MSKAAPKRIKIVCEECRSENVSRDATAHWNIDNQEWELAGIQDQGTCEDCGEERLLEEVEIN